ncbi:MAG: Xaa-Pro peptidase family protein [Rhizobiaceae bacterium]
MALHFERPEYAARMERLQESMRERKLDAVLLFAQESMYWLTGYDTFGFCFFQSLVVKADGSMVLLTRSADLRQARHTSIIDNIVIWTDRAEANPAFDLRNLLSDLGLLGMKIGVEYQTHGLTAANGKRLDEQINTFAAISDFSGIIDGLRAIKSPAELEKVRKAAELGDAALERAMPLIKAGADEGYILAAMHAAIFEGGGDYPANEFIIGSGPDALLCRYKAGRRKLDPQDQLTLEWAGVFHHYHAALMRTAVIGSPLPRHMELQAAAHEALLAVEAAMAPGKTFGEVFQAHADVMDRHNMTRHRLNACGYSLGARFTPSWMDMPMFHANNPATVQPGMVLFAHMIIMDSDTNTAICLGRTSLIGADKAEPLSRLPLDLIVR